MLIEYVDVNDYSGECTLRNKWCRINIKDRIINSVDDFDTMIKELETAKADFKAKVESDPSLLGGSWHR